MKAAQFSQYGAPDVIVVNEIDKPVLKAGQVLVQVHAAAINPFDAKLRQGNMKNTIPLDLPVTIGADFAGVVSQVSADVIDVQIGDSVYGSANVLGGGSGAIAEYAAANVKNIARKPANLSPEKSAAIVLVGVSAYDTIDKLHPIQGSKILIHGGAGGIGSEAIQYAKSLGAYVATTVRAEEVDFVVSLGADQTIDYENQHFENILHDCDGVLDTAGGEVYEKSFKVLKPGGILVSMGMKPNQELAQQYGVTAIIQSTQVNTQSLQRLAEILEQGIITPKVDRIYPIENTADAFTRLELGHPRGKVVVKIG